MTEIVYLTPEEAQPLIAQGFHFRGTPNGLVQFTEAEEAEWSARQVQEPTPPPTVPARVHKVWLIRVLETKGLMDDLEDDMDAAWAAGNKAIKRYWLAASDIYRNDPILTAFAADRQWPPEQLDAWFIQAAGFEAAVTA